MAAGDRKGPGRNFLRDGPEKTGTGPERPGKPRLNRAGRGRPGKPRLNRAGQTGKRQKKTGQAGEDRDKARPDRAATL